MLCPSPGVIFYLLVPLMEEFPMITLLDALLPIPPLPLLGASPYFAAHMEGVLLCLVFLSSKSLY